MKAEKTQKVVTITARDAYIAGACIGVAIVAGTIVIPKVLGGMADAIVDTATFASTKVKVRSKKVEPETE